MTKANVAYPTTRIPFPLSVRPLQKLRIAISREREELPGIRLEQMIKIIMFYWLCHEAVFTKLWEGNLQCMTQAVGCKTDPKPKQMREAKKQTNLGILGPNWRLPIPAFVLLLLLLGQYLQSMYNIGYWRVSLVDISQLVASIGKPQRINIACGMCHFSAAWGGLAPQQTLWVVGTS